MSIDTTTPGTLYLIPVEIGDVPADRYQPPFNLAVIDQLSHFIVENVRTARQYIKKVLPHKVISDLTIYEIDKHKGYAFPSEVLTLLSAGTDVGLMSEAGCPAVADPGHNLVAQAHRLGVRIVPLVGPSSIILSLMASGFNGQRFTFLGYLPFEDHKRKNIFREMKERAQRFGETQIFIEAPYRNERIITEICKALPATLKLSVAIDLTTPDEEIHTHTLAEWQSLLDRQSLVPTFHKRPAIFLINS